jgi:hypothetical protein
VGAKTTPTEQTAAGARLAVHVFCVSANPELTVSASSLAATLPELLMVTVCAALDAPTTVTPKLNCAGLTFSPAAAFPAPLNGTVTGFAPSVEEEMVRAATLPPAVTGVKITSTVQLPPAASDAVQVVVPVAKLPTFAPVIWKPTLAAATAPVLAMVKVWAALATPTFWLAKVRLVGFALNVAGCIPVPERVTVCVRSASETVSTPAWPPSCVGANTTLTVQAEFPANCVPQVFEVWNSAPTETAIEVSASSPVLAKLTVNADDCCPTAVGGNASESGLRVSVGGEYPNPLSSTVCVPAPSTRVSVPVAAPSCVGVKVNCIWQSVSAANEVVPQELLARAKGGVMETLLI